ncbi:MAG: chemotaxis protein CheW [Paracoccaceae bacterium]|nr:chemotaxis protein CheW [Paracoccaceae bacterium]
MAKKFDKISPKNISEEKFNQLVDALPSSTIEQPKPVIVASENKQKADEAKVKKPKKKKKKKLSKEENTKETPKPSKTFPAENFTTEKSNFKINDTTDTSEVFVYECAGILFGIPVAFVTEITNDYGNISPLKGFLRSCVGTTEYRGKLLPIFQSHESYLKINEIKHSSGNDSLEKTPSTIITINFNGIMFALTMETHVGIVTVKSSSSNGRATPVKEENISNLLKDIVWYGEQNLFIFSPEKIAALVYSELKNQIAVGNEEERANKIGDHETETGLSCDYMVAKIKNSTIAIEITQVVEVIEGSEVTPLYKVADFIRGLISLRGQVLSCIDLSRHLGHDLTVIDERNKFIVINVSGVDFALCIDRVLGIKSIQKSFFQDSTKVFQNEIPKYFPNFQEKEGDVTLIFKPDLFLKSTELQEYQKN